MSDKKRSIKETACLIERGRRITLLRKKTGLTAKAFGNACGRTGSAVRSWEKGKVVLTEKSLEAIIRVTGATEDYILNGDFIEQPELKLAEPTIKINGNKFNFAGVTLPDLIGIAEGAMNKAFAEGIAYEKECQEKFVDAPDLSLEEEWTILKKNELDLLIKMHEAGTLTDKGRYMLKKRLSGE